MTDRNDEATQPLLDPEKDEDERNGDRGGGQRAGPTYLMLLGAFVGGIVASCLFMSLCVPGLSASPAQLETPNAKPHLPACRSPTAMKVKAPRKSKPP